MKSSRKLYDPYTFGIVSNFLGIAVDGLIEFAYPGPETWGKGDEKGFYGITILGRTEMEFNF